MSANFNTATLPQFTDLVTRQFEEGLKSLESVMEKSGLVKRDTIPEGTGQYRRYAEMPTRDIYASNKAEGDQASQSPIQYGYEKDMLVKRIGKDISITVEERKYNKYPDIKRKLLDISELAPNRMDLDLAHRLTFMTATSYVDQDGTTVDTTTGDGLALMSASHTLTGSATTYSNALSGNPVFSKSGLAAIEKLAVENTYNNLGKKVKMNFDVIWCSDDPTTNNAIDELMGAKADVTQYLNSGTINVYANKYRKVSIAKLATTADGSVDATKATYWGIASTSESEFHLGVAEAPYLKTPMDGNNGEDFSTENWTYGVRAAYGICITSARWIKCSTGAGS